MNFLPSVCVTRALLCALETTHSRQPGSSVGGSDLADDLKFCPCAAPFPVNTPGRSCLISTSADSEEIKRGEQVQLSPSEQGGLHRERVPSAPECKAAGSEGVA